MEFTKEILGIKVSEPDEWKASAQLGILLGNEVAKGNLDYQITRNKLLNEFPGMKFQQAQELFEKSVKGEKLPFFLMVKRPGKESIWRALTRTNPKLAVLLIWTVLIIVGVGIFHQI